MSRGIAAISFGSASLRLRRDFAVNRPQLRGDSAWSSPCLRAEQLRQSCGRAARQSCARAPARVVPLPELWKRGAGDAPRFPGSAPCTRAWPTCAHPKIGPRSIARVCTRNTVVSKSLIRISLAPLFKQYRHVASSLSGATRATRILRNFFSGTLDCDLLARGGGKFFVY